jgi:hypothetical protein
MDAFKGPETVLEDQRRERKYLRGKKEQRAKGGGWGLKATRFRHQTQLLREGGGLQGI